MPRSGKYFGVATFADDAATSELLINATNGAVIIDILQNIPKQNFDNKVVIGAANALDFSSGMRPRVSITDAAGASRGERQQSYGWKDVLDLGDISSIGALELMMTILLRVWGKLGQTTVFNYKIVR